jgi:replicative DNA helicase
MAKDKNFKDNKPAPPSKMAINLPAGTLPPQNIIAEQSVLGAILLEKEAIFKVVDKVTPADFYREDHGLIFEAMLALTEKRKPVDVLTLSDQLEKSGQLEQIGGATYLSELVAQVGSAGNIATYGELIKNTATLRNLIKAGSEIVQLGLNTQSETDVLLDQAEQALYNVSQQFLKEGFTPIQDILSITFERIDELHKNKGQIRGIPSGFKDLDNLLAGFQKSDLIIIAARPSMGKTTFALNIASHAAIKEKIPVAIFSLEQSQDQLVDRMLVSEAQVDSWKLRTGNLSDEDFPRIGYAMGVLSEAPIWIDDSPLVNVMEMRAKARRLQAERGLGLIIVDYLQLMSGRNRSNDGSRVQEISEISRGLKGIARELNVPIIALSQLSRAVELRQPKVPQLSDLRESGSIEQDADVVAFIYREDYYEPETERKHIADIMIKKHRNGPIGNIELFWAAEQMKFGNISHQRENQPTAKAAGPGKISPVEE